MRRIAIIITLFFAIILCIVGCEKIPKCCDYQNNCHVIEINDKECLAMCGEPKICTANSSIKLIMYNHTKNIIQWGGEYRVEYFNGINWLPMEYGCGIVEYILYGTESGKKEEMQFSLSYGDFSTGKYRVFKDVALEHKIKSGDYNHLGSYALFFEFEIK
jgi:hypothetical protein